MAEHYRNARFVLWSSGAMIMLVLCGYVKNEQSSREGDTSLARAPRALPCKLNGHVLRLHEFRSGPRPAEWHADYRDHRKDRHAPRSVQSWT